ncbi:response regulator [Silvanigrella paludirubra]|uniref:Response regulator n=2 Tax=Silvanigrella paludirubra TaxID=2499159 RepID=A0A6N6VXS3_9BACT|nr:response regulator [Silvanigrella paludirubra]
MRGDMVLKHQYPSDKDVFNLIQLDDDPLELKNLAKILKSNPKNIKFQVSSFLTIRDLKLGIKEISEIDFAILDIYLSDDMNQTGISVVQELKNNHPNIIILMSSNLDDPDTILQSLRAGADEFISKKMEKNNVVEKIFQVRKSVMNKRGINISDKKEEYIFNKYSGETMKKISRRIPQIMNSAITSVYIEGESGTGKEVVAELFEDYAKNIPFVKMNCGSISPSLLESELFGYVKGAFTGATSNKPGLLESASGGWFFLDEVASLSHSAQVALLRALENQEVTRIGESVSRKINIRFIAASNVPLILRVKEGLFRNDLWQRLCETEIILKPLRERKTEIPDLIMYFCRTMKGGPYKIENTALNVLCKLSWNEGNVRELRNCLRAMTEHQTNKILTPLGIPERILLKNKDLKDLTKINEEEFIKIPIKNENQEFLSYEKMTEILWEKYFQKISEEKINITKLSKKLGIARSTLQLKIKKLKLKK